MNKEDFKVGDSVTLDANMGPAYEMAVRHIGPGPFEVASVKNRSVLGRLTSGHHQSVTLSYNNKLLRYEDGSLIQASGSLLIKI